MSSGRWFAASRPDLGAFTFSSSLLPDASAASLDPDPLPPRPLAGSWAAAAPGTAPAAGSSGASSAAGQAALGQAQFAVAHGDRVLLSGGYFDGSLRWVWESRGGTEAILAAALYRLLGGCLALPGPKACSAVWQQGACCSLRHMSVQQLLTHHNFSPCRVHSSDDGRLLQALAYHKDLVTCVAASSGEQPATCLDTVRGRVRSGSALHEVAHHKDLVTCVAASSEELSASFMRHSERQLIIWLQ